MTIRIATIVAALAVVISSGCHHAANPATTIVPVPIGLDSAGEARWLSQQRADCRGRLIKFLDEGGAVRNLDSVARGTTVQFHSGLVGVQCRP